MSFPAQQQRSYFSAALPRYVHQNSGQYLPFHIIREISASKSQNHALRGTIELKQDFTLHMDYIFQTSLLLDVSRVVLVLRGRSAHV